MVLAKISDSSISITGNTDEFRGTGVLNFMDLDPVFGFMTAFLNVSGTSSFILGGNEKFLATAVFSKQAPTPIPGAIWLLGSGLVGLVGFRKKFKK